MKALVGCLAALVVVAGISLGAQQKDAEMDRLVQEYIAAWNKADVKALVGLYADNAMRTGATPAEPIVGKAAIEKYYEAGFATTAKGTTLSVTPGRTQNVTADLRLQEGTWQVKGGAGPQSGRYYNTLVRVGGTWRIAAVVTIPDTAAK